MTQATKTKAKAKLTTSTELRNILLSKNTLGYVLGVASTGIEQIAQQGILKRDADGHYSLLENVAAYIVKLRQDIKEAKRIKNSRDDELQFWKTEKVKQQVKSWRLERDREISLQILAALRNSINALRDKCKDHADMAPAFDNLLSAIDTIDIDRISDIVEGDADTEDDE